MPLPETIRVSFGTAITLGLRQARQEVAPTTAYLLWDPGCRGSCSFCPRAGGNAGSDRLSRIAWPEVPWAEVVGRLASRPGPLRRICLQTGWNDGAAATLPLFIAALRPTGLPLSLTLHPAQLPLVGELLAAGLDHLGLGLDAAGPATYQRHKGRPWDADWPALRDALDRHGPRLEIHLIYGLGDTERAFLEVVEAVLARGGLVALFAFTPARGRGSPPPLDAWRRVQAFRHLRLLGALRWEDCRFAADGRLVSFGLAPDRLAAALADGKAFQTSGCPDCNRPFYNERPGGIMYNFPRPLTPAEVRQAVADLHLPE
ncbi:MAG: radical SAM protein [Candidatus Riflebacteria bacterium]|nr:radical SAM protein [Candidatus Riflebacteria bacterium]